MGVRAKSVVGTDTDDMDVAKGCLAMLLVVVTGAGVTFILGSVLWRLMGWGIDTVWRFVEWLVTLSK